MDRSRKGRGGMQEPRVRAEFKFTKAGRKMKHCPRFPRCEHRGVRKEREWERYGGTDGAFGNQKRAGEGSGEV